jgi:hypothetical protein
MYHTEFHESAAGWVESGNKRDRWRKLTSLDVAQ